MGVGSDDAWVDDPLRFFLTEDAVDDVLECGGDKDKGQKMRLAGMEMPVVDSIGDVDGEVSPNEVDNVFRFFQLEDSSTTN